MEKGGRLCPQILNGDNQSLHLLSNSRQAFPSCPWQVPAAKSMRDHKIMQKACYGRHKPSPKRCQMKQGSFKRVHSWRRSNTGGKREPATPLWGPHFVTKYVPKCHRKLFFKVNIGSNEKRCLEATRMKTNSVPKLTKMLPPNK